MLCTSQRSCTTGRCYLVGLWQVKWRRWERRTGLAEQGMVEAVGIEPTSEDRVPEASTCVAFVWSLAPAFWKKASDAGASIVLTIPPRYGANRGVHSTLASPRRPPWSGQSTRRRGQLSRECEVVVGRYKCRFYGWLSPARRPRTALIPVEPGTPPVEKEPPCKGENISAKSPIPEGGSRGCGLEGRRSATPITWERKFLTMFVSYSRRETS